MVYTSHLFKETGTTRVIYGSQRKLICKTNKLLQKTLQKSIKVYGKHSMETEIPPVKIHTHILGSC